MEFLFFLIFGLALSFILYTWWSMWRAGRKHGGGIVGQALAMKEQLEAQLQTECKYCGATIPRSPEPCPACGARD